MNDPNLSPVETFALLVASAVQAIRVVEPTVAVGPPSQALIRSLRELFGVGITRGHCGNLCEPRAREQGEQVRRAIRAGLPDRLDKFLQLQTIGRAIFRSHAWMRAAADAFALALLFPRESRQDAWVDDLLVLNGVDPAPHWAAVDLPNLLAVSDLVLALVDPVHPARDKDGLRVARAAYLAGRNARRRGEFADAERWLAVAERVGFETGDMEAVAGALLNGGLVLKERDGAGGFAQAERLMSDALAVAGIDGLGEMRGRILHDLAALAMERKDVGGASTFATQAFQQYGARHPMVARLLHDVGYMWIEARHFRSALDLLDFALARATDPSTAGSIHANMARAAAGTGLRGAYSIHFRAAAALTAKMSAWEGGCALMHMAEAALCMGDFDEARAAAGAAVLHTRRNGLVSLRTQARDWFRRTRERRWICHESNADTEPVSALLRTVQAAGAA